MEGCLARVYRNSKPRYFLSYNLYDNSYYSTILTVGIDKMNGGRKPTRGKGRNSM